MSIEKQYEGYINTPTLWINDSEFQLSKLVLPKIKQTQPKLSKIKKLRLGKLVERFVSFELSQYKNITVLAENIQIQDHKITIGEIDCLLKIDNTPIHLEIVYKFYLYDNSVGNTEIEHWIGPNRKDSLIEKVTKLKEKQLPLLYNKKTRPYLDKLDLNITTIKQAVYFKAQLFVPLSIYGNKLALINNDCIYGFYIFKKELHLFKSCQFYIPNKHNWLIKCDSNVNWLDFKAFKTIVNSETYDKQSPMCWLRKTTGETLKFFIVFW